MVKDEQRKYEIQYALILSHSYVVLYTLSHMTQHDSAFGEIYTQN